MLFCLVRVLSSSPIELDNRPAPVLLIVRYIPPYVQIYIKAIYLLMLTSFFPYGRIPAAIVALS